MSGRLRQIIQRVLTEVGTIEGEKKLARAVGRSERTIRRWVREGIPTTHDAYKLAIACGCTKDEALALASEGPEEVAKRA